MFSNLNILNIFSKIIKKIDKKDKLLIVFLIPAALISSFFEIVSIASLLPLLELLFNSGKRSSSLINFLDLENINDEKLFFTVLFIIIIFISIVVKIALNVFTVYVGTRIGHGIITKTHKVTMFQNYDFFLGSHSSKFASNLEKSSNTHAFVEHFLQIVIATVLLFSILIFTLSINFKILIIIFLIVSLLYICLSLITKKFNQRVGLDYNFEIENRIKIINETFFNIKQIIISRLHSYFLEQFKNSNLRFMKSIYKNTLLANIPGNLVVFFGISSLSIIMYLLSKKDIPVENSIALFGAIIFAFQKIFSQSQIIYSNYVKIKFTKNSAIDVLKIFEMEKFDQEKFTHKNISFNKNIKIKNGTYKYDKAKMNVFENLNLNIKKGESVFILGDSGRGKSTLLNILSGLSNLTQGEILIDGKLLNKDIVQAWFRKIFYLSQNPQLFDDTIISNIVLNISKINKKKFKESLNISGLDKLIEQGILNKDKNIGEKGKRISGGQRQRIMIARAIYANKDVLILDEATNSLDKKSEEEVFNNLIKLSKEKTLIVVSHHASLSRKFDQVINLNVL